jgi:hypothetical protein
MYTLIICNSDGSLGRHEHQTLQDIAIKLNNALYNMPGMVTISLIKE